MLTLTDSASEVVRAIVAQNSALDEAGLRINADDPAATDFQVAITGAPEADDAVVEKGGARVFLNDNAAVALDDKVLDAKVENDGAIRFEIGNQPPTGG